MDHLAKYTWGTLEEQEKRMAMWSPSYRAEYDAIIQRWANEILVKQEELAVETLMTQIRSGQS